MSQPPSWSHLFGTDEVGRDYFIRVVYGGRVSLFVGVLAMITATFIGTLVGLVSGYFGGWIDNLLMRLVDVLSSIPWLVLVIVLSVFLRPGLTTMIIVIGGFSWMNIARLIRGETLAAKERGLCCLREIYRPFFIQYYREACFPSSTANLDRCGIRKYFWGDHDRVSIEFPRIRHSAADGFVGQSVAKCAKQFAAGTIHGDPSRALCYFHHLFLQQHRRHDQTCLAKGGVTDEDRIVSDRSVECDVSQQNRSETVSQKAGSSDSKRQSGWDRRRIW